jgi:alpha-L-rhamnosidase
MRPFLLFLGTLALCINLGRVSANDTTLQIHDLRCEYLSNPSGLDVAHPRLSWKIRDSRRNILQTAYQILVATDVDLLSPDGADLWDTGRIASDQSIHVPYAGKPLDSHLNCFWKVRIWDNQGQVSAWSPPARWSMGILNAEDWEAKWLSYVQPLTRQLPQNRAAQQLTLDGVAWIWAPEADQADRTAGATRYFRHTVDLPEDAVVQWAYATIACTEPYRLFVNGEQASKSYAIEHPAARAYEVEMTEKLSGGSNLLAFDIPEPDSGSAGLAMKLVVQLKTGEIITTATDSTWKAALRGQANWQTPACDDQRWSTARHVATVGDAPWGTPRPGPRVGWSQQASSPLFRKSFEVGKPIRRATAYICGLGYHELSINGQKVGDHVLDPGFTRYDRRALYVTHDVTQQVQEGRNAIGVMLGNGWYNMFTRATWDFDQAAWRAPPTLLFHLRIEYQDETTETIVSDESWQAATGPVVLDGIRAGEVYDARLERTDWDTASFDASDWDAPQITDGPAGTLSAQAMPPMRVTETVKPIAILEPRPGVYVFDMGQQFAGWVRLTVEGPAGTQVTMRYSERIDDQSMIERSEISKFVFEGPFQTDIYTLKGQGTECWEPRFAYHGFRYVEVTGFPGTPTKDNVTGCVVHTDFERQGQFQCSNGLLNQIQRMTRWSYRNNFHGYPTDCPTREKNGWTGDAHLAAEQAMYNFENSAAYSKWIMDIDDEQQDSGEVAAIIPTAGWGYAWGNGPAWDSALVIIPWYLYGYRGDTEILRRHYDAMRQYVDYLTARSKNHIVDFGLGDWVPADTVTPHTITSTAYYYIDTRIVAWVARLLGKTDDAAKYAARAKEIRAAFNREFDKGDGVYLDGSQTALSCTLYQGLVPDSNRANVVNKLVEQVNARDNHLDVGILGAKYLFHSLSDNGHHDLAYQIATQTTPPSYGDWATRGATTLWEDWKGVTSLNHVMFGDISNWFYQKLAGINVGQPGFKHIVIRPMPVGDLKWVKAKTPTMYGSVQVDWKQDNDNTWLLSLNIPVNTTATVHLPTKDISSVTEGETSVADIPDITSVGGPKESVRLQIGSGEYHFRVSN